MNKLKLLVIFMLILIVCLPFTQAQACAISLRKDDIGKVIDELKTKLPSDFSDEKMTYFIRRSFEKEFVKLSQSFGLDEEYPLSYIEYISDRPLEDLIISFNVLTELRNRYGITDEEIAEGIKNKNLLEVVRDKAEGDIENDITDIEEVKTSSERKNSVSSPFLVSSVLAMTLVLSTIIKSNVATNEAIGRELAMGSKASVSVVVNAPSTEVSQEEQTQEIIEDLIPTLEPEITEAPTLEGDDYEKYNQIVPVINELANEYNLDPKILAAIILHESNGNANAEGDKDQTTRDNRYKAIKADFANNQNYKEYYNALKEKGIIQTEEEFFQLTSKASYGLFQISPQTAALRGFRDNPEQLKDARTNIEIAIKELIAKGFKPEDRGIEGLTKASQIINRGKVGLTPHKGYLESVKTFFEQLEKESDLNNKGIHCRKGSTVCYLETSDIESAKTFLYDVFVQVANKEKKSISDKNSFFTISSDEKGFWLKTEFDVDNIDEIEDLYKGRITVVKNSRTNAEKLAKAKFDLKKNRLKKELLILLKKLTIANNQEKLLDTIDDVTRSLSYERKTSILGDLTDLLVDTTNDRYYPYLVEFLYNMDNDQLLRDLIARLKLPPTQIIQELPLTSKKMSVPEQLNVKNSIFIIDTGFIIDLILSYPSSAPQIVQELAKTNQLLILESTWNEIIVHHNTFIAGKREISPEMMSVLRTIYESNTNVKIQRAPSDISDLVLLSYYEEFYGDTRKYEKDPMSENDEEIIYLGLIQSTSKPVLVLSKDAHVNRILQRLNKQNKYSRLQIPYVA